MMDYIKKLIKQESKGLEIKPENTAYQNMSALRKIEPAPSNEVKKAEKPVEVRLLNLELRFNELEALLTQRTPNGSLRLNSMGRRFRK